MIEITDEMCKRYHCTPRTLNTMERDGRIPFRKAGKWNRSRWTGVELHGKTLGVVGLGRRAVAVVKRHPQHAQEGHHRGAHQRDGHHDDRAGGGQDGASWGD